MVVLGSPSRKSTWIEEEPYIVLATPHNVVSGCAIAAAEFPNLRTNTIAMIKERWSSNGKDDDIVRIRDDMLTIMVVVATDINVPSSYSDFPHSASIPLY